MEIMPACKCELHERMSTLHATEKTYDPWKAIQEDLAKRLEEWDQMRRARLFSAKH